MKGIWHLAWLVIGVVALGWQPREACAQFGPSTSRQISSSVKLDEATTDARRFLDQVEALLRDAQWTEAVDAAQRVMAEHGQKVVSVSPVGSTYNRYVTVREFCYLRLTDPRFAGVLPIYRQGVDPLARRWYEEAVLRRDSALLQRVIEQAFPSSWTDDALWKLGDWALERGDFMTARKAWQTILPPPADMAEMSRASTLSYPDTDLKLADVYARLVLVSILEGSRARAEVELETSLAGGHGFRERYPEARGKFAGKEGKYVDLLSEWLSASERWPAPRHDPDWVTFAGAVGRNHRLPPPVPLAGRAWEEAISLQPVKVQPAAIDREYSFRRVGEESGHPLSYHPVVVGEQLFVAQQKQVGDGRLCVDEILAYNLATGKPAWGNEAVIYRSAEMPFFVPRSLQIPRFTLTVQGDKLFARTGGFGAMPDVRFGVIPESARPSLICLDLVAQGKFVWQTRLDAHDWIFEGAPISDGRNVYVGLRQLAATPMCYLACYDAENGREKWRRFIASAETRTSTGEMEISSNLLTLAGETIYYNTNLGAIAAVAARDGAVRWITTYARTSVFDLSKPLGFYYRDLNPCVVEKGQVFVAPSDTPDVLSLDAATGQLLWRIELPDVTHLLGARSGRLIAAGDRIYWIGYSTARPTERPQMLTWFGGGSSPGYGRGVIVGNVVYWPTRFEIHVFDVNSGIRRDVIRLLRDPAFGQPAGNLVVSNGFMVVAQPDRLVGFSQFSPRHRQQAEARTRAQAEQALAWFELARCEDALEDWTPAAEHYARALSLARPEELWQGELLAVASRSRLYTLLVRHAATDQAAQAWDAAAGRLTRAAEIAATPVDRLRALFASAEVWIAAGQSAPAVQVWQRILAEDRLAELSVAADDGRPIAVPTWIAQLQQSIAAANPAIEADLARAAAAAWKLAKEQGDIARASRWLEQHPQSPFASECRLWLAAQYESQQQFLAARRLYRTAREAAGSTAAAAPWLARQARAEERANLLPEVIATWKSLADRYPTLASTALLDGAAPPGIAAKHPTAAGLAQAKITELNAALEARRAAAAQPVLWQLEPGRVVPEQVLFPTEIQSPRDRVAAPAGGIAAAHAGAVLFASEVSFYRPAQPPIPPLRISGAPQSAGYAADGVWLHWPDRLACLDIERGEWLWNRRLAEVDEPLADPFLRPTATAGSPILRRQEATGDAKHGSAPLEQVVASGERLFVRQGRRQLLAIDSATGAVDWIYQPGADRLLPHLAVTSKYVVVERTSPPKCVVLDVENGQTVHELESGRSGWAMPPFVVDANRVITIPHPNEIELWDLEKGQKLWTRSILGGPGALLPQFRLAAGDVLVFLEHEAIERLALTTGEPVWAPQPLPGTASGDAADWSLVDETRVYGAAQGYLRALSLASGKQAWDEDCYLGPAEHDWRIARLGGLLAAYPGRTTGERPIELVLIDPATGLPAARLTTEDRTPAVDVRLIGTSALVAVRAQAGAVIWKLSPLAAGVAGTPP